MSSVYPFSTPPTTNGQPQGYTSGPTGSSGGLTGAPPQQNPYGYGTAPGQNGYGYYEQQTPAGSFGAANQQYSQGQQPVGAQYGYASQASNPYINQTTQGIGYQPSMMGYAQQGQYQNPYLGQQSMYSQQQGANPYGMGNPYLQQSIDATSQDATKNFTNSVMPGLDRMMQASGSFGNSGVQAMQGQAYSDLGRNLGNISNSARMQDYTQQQQLAENAMNRNQANNQFNSSLSAQDLNRNMQGGFQQANQNNGLLMQAGMFDANMANGVNQFNAGLQQNDLSRQTNASLGLGTFNAGQQNQMSQFNAGQGNNMGQFNANMGQQNNQFNAGQGNGMNMFNVGQGNQMLNQVRNNQQQQNQFDANLDRGIYNDNMNWMRQGQQDQIGLYDTMQRWGQNGVNNAGTIQNTPMNYWQQFMNGANQAGQNGGSSTNSQMYQGNPYLGAFGGWMTGGNMYNNWGG